ncbi:MAG: hypothetical protein M1818_003241 [Claussenomyces sp. TS43310]|nr:MAG: hypothetical protein M1818_003241 [Claussenomyces sp. TS43310]
MQQQASIEGEQKVMWSEDELRRNVGQLFIVGFDGQTPNVHIRTLIQTYHVGAVVLFSRNISSASQLLSLTQDLQNLAKDSGHKQPLLIGIDQENGLVTNIKPPIASQLPGSMALGATGDAKDAYETALATGEMLSYFGINMNYAPVADINSEPSNPVIGVRSPADVPEMVGRLVSAQVKAFREQGIVPCIKHFPGHGDTAVDSHYGLPVSNKSKTQLEECELVPFRRAVAEGVEAVMTAHIALPCLDEDGGNALPASLSREAMNVLRKDLGYDGMVVSDCLEMDGVRKTFGTETGAVMALKTGSDCAMICHTPKVQMGAIEEVISAVKSGELSQASLEASVARVTRVKGKFLSWPATQPKDAGILEEMNIKHDILAEQLYARSTTLVRAQHGLLPLAQGAKIVYLSPGTTPRLTGVISMSEADIQAPCTPSEYYDILASHCPGIVGISYLEDRELDADAWQTIKAADALILATRNARLSQYQLDLGLRLGQLIGNKLIVIATCDPYDFLNETSVIPNYIAIYEPTVPAFKSAADVIFGATKAEGTLPVCNPQPQHMIRAFDETTDTLAISELWNKVLPSWHIPSDRLAYLLAQESGQHVVLYQEGRLTGVCIAYWMSAQHATITSVIVSPQYQGRGYGTALLCYARRALQHSVPQLKKLTLGSGFPRYWPGLPMNLPDKDRQFFTHRGFRRTAQPSARDFYQDIRHYTAPEAVMDRAAKAGLTFAPWREDLVEECLTKQRKNFGNNADWVMAYEKLATAKQYHDIMVAFDSAGSQIGWTLMCSPSSPVCQSFAFMPLMGPQTGLIACVGVDAEARKGGVGLAMLASAMENMRKRGVEGVLIDWVVLRGFYEKLGYEVWKDTKNCDQEANRTVFHFKIIWTLRRSATDAFSTNEADAMATPPSSLVGVAPSTDYNADDHMKQKDFDTTPKMDK